MIPQHLIEITNEIRMLRPHYQNTFLVVEGQDDYRFMRSFISRETCDIIIARGKQNVRDIIDFLEENNIIGVLGLIDADFDRIEGAENTSLNVVMPECHDLDAMLVYSPAFDKVFDEFTSEDKVIEFGKDVLQALVDRTLQLAYLRLHSLRSNLRLRFRDMNYAAWIDVRSFDASVDRLILEIKNRSQRQDLPSDELRLEMETIENSKYDPCEMCNGTDLIGIFSVGLRRVLGTRNVSIEEMRRSLRLAYSEQDFIKSDLYAEIKAWEARVSIFQILHP